MLKLLSLCIGVLVISTATADWAHNIQVRQGQKLGPEEEESDFWREKAQQSLAERLAIKENKNVAKNVILFIGDGMSIPTLTAARVYQSEVKGIKTGEGGSLFFENFPYTGLSKTYCVDLKVADSACSATAYLGGVKGNEGTIGVNAKVLRRDCDAMNVPENKVDSIAKWFQDAGLATGIVTTTRVTHASPAGVYAHVADRDWEDDSNVNKAGQDTEKCDDIAEQLVLNEPGNKFNVIMGGGRSQFLPSGSGGNRLDKKNLIDTWTESRDANYAYVSNRDELMNLTTTPSYILGLFGNDHLDYHYQNNTQQPKLAEMTKIAIEVLQKTQKGFFLFVEGGKIDLAHHDNRAHVALDETMEFQKAVEVAKQMTDETDTLLVVTADHAHTMSYAGYPARAETIFAAGGTGSDGKPYSSLSYNNGPGYKNPVNNERYDISNDDMTDFEYRFPAGAPLGSETHGGDDVAVFATGPWAHLFVGSYEENYIPHAMAYASCVGSGNTVCKSNNKKC